MKTIGTIQANSPVASGTTTGENGSINVDQF